jgi:colanic acid/amylovoran biosynthesis glycosyltransferase
MSDSIKKGSLAYVISRYTYQSPFIVREIEELAIRGWSITVLSLRPPVFEPGCNPSALPFEVRYDRYLSSQLMIGAIIGFIRQPRAVVDYVRLVLLGYRRKPAAAVRNLGIIPKAIFYSTLARQRRWRHLHAHWATVSTSAAMLISRLANLSFSFTGHAWDIFVDTTLLAEKAHAARFVLTCTEFNREYLVDVASLPREKIQVLYHGLPFQDARSSSLLVDGPLRILTVARWSAKKGLLELAEALSVARRRGVAFTFRLIAGGGSPDYEQRVRQALSESGLNSRTEILPWLPHGEVLEAMEHSDLFVLPSVRTTRGDMDGIPNVLVEALSVGLPVIATRLSGIPEVVRHGETGLLVNEGDINGVAAAIEWCASHRQEARELAAAGRRLVRSAFDIDTTTTILEQRFTTTIQSTTGGT